MREPDMERVMAVEKRRSEIMDTLDDSLPVISRIVIAGDRASGERWLADALADKIEPEKAVWLTGSYARVDNAVALVQAGRLTRDWLLANWADIWRGSDPDDTNPEYWDIWFEAFEANGGRILDDENRDVPDEPYVTIYRGQIRGATIGCSWSTSRTVAERFAKHGGLRAAIIDGEIIETDIPRGMILAFLTERSEYEVIIDPRPLQRKRDET